MPAIRLGGRLFRCSHSPASDEGIFHRLDMHDGGKLTIGASKRRQVALLRVRTSGELGREQRGEPGQTEWWPFDLLLGAPLVNMPTGIVHGILQVQNRRMRANASVGYSQVQMEVEGGEK